MQQIKSVGILQTAKVSGAMYLIFSAVFAIPFAVIGALGAVVSGKPDARRCETVKQSHGFLGTPMIMADPDS